MTETVDVGVCGYDHRPHTYAQCQEHDIRAFAAWHKTGNMSTTRARCAWPDHIWSHWKPQPTEHELRECVNCGATDTRNKLKSS
jgi:hypothetical protein